MSGMNLNGSKIIGGGDKKDRKESDFYPSPPEVTHALMRFMDPMIKRRLKIWEPCCGDGDMSEVMKSYGHEVWSTDLRATDYCDQQLDFLNHDRPEKFDAIITNPPFNVSQEIILKALESAPVVAMVLKSQYWHAKGRAQMFENNTPAFVLPMTWRPNFNTLAGNAPTMDVMWTVWSRGNHKARYMPLLKPVL